MNVLNTDIIPAAQDIFWADFPEYKGLEPRPVLIFSTGFAPGSSQEEQLNAIIKAGCKLKDSDYNLIKLTDGGTKLPWHAFKEQSSLKVVLMFGIATSQLGISALFRLNEINRFDGRFWVPTLSPDQLIQDKMIRGQLWNNALKPLFDGKIHGEII